MASLTDNITDPNLQGKPVREPPAPSNGLGTVLKNISNAVDIFDQGNKEAAANDRAKAQAARQAKEDAYKTDEQRIPYEALQAALRAKQAQETSGGIDPNSPFSVDMTEASNIIADPNFIENQNSALEKLKNVRMSVSQRRMPSISLDAAMNKEYLALANRFPDHVGAINQAFKNSGFEPSMVIQEFQDKQKTHDSELENNLKFEDDMFRKGAEGSDPAFLATASREDVIAIGINATNKEHQLDLLTKQANLTLTQKNISKEDADAAGKDLNEGVLATMGTDTYNQMNPLVTALQQAMIEVGKLPEGQQLQAFQQLAPKFEQWAQNYKAQAVAQARSVKGVTTETINALEKQIDDRIAGVRAMWSGDMSQAKVNQDALTALTTAAKTNAAKAMPVYFALKQAGFSADEISTLSGGVQANPKLQEMLKKELSGYMQDFGEDRASTHILNIARILKGQTGLADLTPQQVQKAMPSLFQISKQTAGDYVSGRTKDAGGVLNSTAAVINAARSVSPQSDYNTYIKATLGITLPQVRTALIMASRDPVHAEMAKAEMQGSLAASANLLDVMNAHVNDFNRAGWTIMRKDGYLVPIQRTVAVKTTGGSGFLRAEGGSSVNKLLPMPVEMKTFIDTYNSNIRNVVELSQHVPTTDKPATPLQIAQFYAEGKTSEPFQNSKGVMEDPNSAFSKSIAILDRAFEAVPSMNKDVKVGGWAPRSSDGGDNSNKAIDNYIGHVSKATGLDVNQTFSREQVPAIARAMAEFESGGKPSARSMRNNNPGNIIDAPWTRSMPGYKGSDGHFAIFDSPAHGWGAMETLIGRKLNKGHNTIAKLIEGVAKRNS